MIDILFDIFHGLFGLTYGFELFSSHHKIYNVL
jgi:hypothetical protein